jgi:outer membrane protein OmpA-like peptidoglycan-associated protein
MKTACSTMALTIGLMGFSVAAIAGDAKPRPPEEPAGFITGGIIGGLAAGPIGAVIGAGFGTWLGNRVHRAGEAARAESAAAVLRDDNARLLTENPREDEAKVLDGLQGDVLFRTGSAEIAPEMVQGIEVLAQAVAKSPALKVRVDGYADARGPVDTNLKLSEQRANAVRELFLAAGVQDSVLEINAYGKSLSTAQDNDGYALERRVRLTLQAGDSTAVAQNK